MRPRRRDPELRGLRRPALRRGTALAAALAAASLAAGCGGEGGADQIADAGTGSLGARPGKVTCDDWKHGTVDERLGTIEQLTLVAGGNANPADVGPNRVMSAEDAYDLFEGWCGAYAARGFLLYDLYNRGAVFTPPDS